MISKNQLKLIRALGQKKYRKEYNQYLVQGEKNVLELLNSGLSIAYIFATPAFISAHQSAPEAVLISDLVIRPLGCNNPPPPVRKF